MHGSRIPFSLGHGFRGPMPPDRKAPALPGVGVYLPSLLQLSMREGKNSNPLSILLTVCLLFSAPVRAAKVCASDPFADPASDPCDVLGYIASNALTTVAIGESILCSVMIWYEDI